MELRVSEHPPPGGGAALQTRRLRGSLMRHMGAIVLTGVPLVGLFVWMSAPWARAGEYPAEVGQSFRDCADCPEMMVIPAGRFRMGSPAEDNQGRAEERPAREVLVQAALAVGKFEVTFNEWDVCVDAGGCTLRLNDNGWGRWRQPVVNATWEDAQKYVDWLSNRTRRRYRLLTEAEWEYAARADYTSYAFGNTIDSRFANFGNSIGRPQPVGSYAPNQFGLHDMSGNVWEWVQDCFQENYANASRLASQAASSNDCQSRVLRGGAYHNSSLYLRYAFRLRTTPTTRNLDIGFRIARMPNP